LSSRVATPVELYHVLRRCWSPETSSKWLPDNPARGQCSVTSLIVQDVFGGEILKTRIGPSWHFYNRIGETRWDLTVSQFDVPIPFDDLLASRDEVLADTSVEQYQLLSQRVQVTGKSEP
jgi:hypothetical protein